MHSSAAAPRPIAGPLPTCADNQPVTVTPADCPRKKLAAKIDTAAPRTRGAICVAFTCSVLCSM
jgi:hypothetical protein